VFSPGRVFAMLVVLYLLTATWRLPYGVDPFSNALTGWAIATTGSPVIDSVEPLLYDGDRGFVAWIVPGTAGPVSQYPPGAALTTVPAYWASRAGLQPVTFVGPPGSDLDPVRIEVPPVWPATLSAVVTTAAALLVLALTLERLGLSRGPASLAALVAGLATSAWSIASGKSWMHGPAMLSVALAGLAASRDR
jgi:hypothetical protein